MLSCSVFSITANRQIIYIRNLGLDKIESAEERYKVLYNTHCDAVENGSVVSYKGISRIAISIPYGAKSIPLNGYEEFCGVAFDVLNTKIRHTLFSLSSNPISITIDKNVIDKGIYASFPEFRNGTFMLEITDNNPWVEERIGYGYPHIRKDIVMIKDGYAQNATVCPYDNAQSLPVCHYVPIDGSIRHFGNLTLNRKSESTVITCLISVMNMSNIEIHDVIINTPDNLTL